MGVDVERGRTVKGWLPRRLGGGLGGTRKGGADVNVRHSGRDDSRRDRSRERDRGDRDRDRRRDRSRSRDRKRRSRSRDRRRDRKRSRSRDRKRSKRSRSRSRDRDARRRERREKREGGGDDFRVKEEPADTGYNDQYGNNYDYQGVNIKQEKVEDENGEGGDGHDDNGQDYDAGY